MLIEVRTTTGKRLELEVEAITTIKDIKNRIHDLEGIPIDQQTLMYSGKTLRDELKLSDYFIWKGATLSLLTASVGFPGPNPIARREAGIFRRRRGLWSAIGTPDLNTATQRIEVSVFGRSINIFVGPQMTINDLKLAIAAELGGDGKDNVFAIRLKIDGSIVPLAQGTKPLAVLPGYPSWKYIMFDLISTRPYKIRIDAGKLGCALLTVMYSDSFGVLKPLALSKLRAGGNQLYDGNIDEETLEFCYGDTRSDSELLVDAGVEAGSTLLLRRRIESPALPLKHPSGSLAQIARYKEEGKGGISPSLYRYLGTDPFPSRPPSAENKSNDQACGGAQSVADSPSGKRPIFTSYHCDSAAQFRSRSISLRCCLDYG
jgi:hypothetical protein